MIEVQADTGLWMPSTLEGSDGVGDIDPNDLPISIELRRLLNCWAVAFNANLILKKEKTTALTSMRMW